MNIPALARALVPFIERSVSEKRKMDNPALEEAAAKAMGMTRKELVADPQYSKKIVQESFESALVQHIRKNNVTDIGELTDLYNNQPNLNQRTGTSVTNQAYSTPVNLVGMLTKALGVKPSDTVLEPTAGTGLLVSAMPNRDGNGMFLNEIDPRRLILLRDSFPKAKITDHDATVRIPGRQVSVVVANPPFGQLEKPVIVSTQKGVIREFPISKLEHLIAWRAMERMEDDGVSALIFGADREPGIHGTNKSFLTALYNQFNVKGHFEIDGKLYSRQGAAWPITVLLIQGRRDFRSGTEITPPSVVPRFSSWSEVQAKTEQIGKEINRAKVSGNRSGGVPLSSPSGDHAGSEGSGGTSGGSSGTSGQKMAEKMEGPESEGRNRTGSRRGRKSVVAEASVGSGAVSSGTTTHPTSAPSVPKAVSEAAKPELRPARGGEIQPGHNLEQPLHGTERSRIVEKEEKRTELQTTYKEKSKASSGSNLIPVNLENPIREALENLEKSEHKTIDEYVADELGVDVEALYGFLDGVQVDAVGLAIQAVKQDAAIVNADQTGVGKGRTAAVMIHWALKNGKLPLFMTEKAALFADIYRDLRDTMGADLRPFILNSDGIVTEGETKKVIWKPPSAVEQNRVLNNMKAKDLSDFGPDGKYDFILSTYSQIGSRDTDKAGVLKALKIDALTAGNTFFPILDEAHNASGINSGTGEYVKEILENNGGVYYLSATWAKRPDSMGIFFKAIGGDPEALTEAFIRGGAGMQELVVSTMASSGRYIRREQDFSDIKWHKNVTPENMIPAERKIADEAMRCVRSIVSFASEINEFLKDKDNVDNIIAMIPGGMDISQEEQNDVAKSVGTPDEFSTVHHFVEQLLAAVKTKRTVARAIEMVKAGQKPVIAIRNTMESLIEKIEPGDMGEFHGTYKDLLKIILRNGASFIARDPMDPRKRITVRIRFEEMPPAMKAAYVSAMQEIDSAEIPDDLPFSPIDYIENEIRKAGYQVGEITGRSKYLDYSGGGVPTISVRPGTENTPKRKNEILKGFNDGQIDVLVINESGATGISAHSSKTVKDQRQRTMLIIQPLLDINKFMQILGRIHRKGAVTSQEQATHLIQGKPATYGHPYYEYIQSGMEMELRPAAVLQNKMKSLNAQTSSNQKGHHEVATIDFFNKYGDAIAVNWVRDNPEVGVAIKAFTKDSLDVATDVNASWVARRISILPQEIQIKFWSEVSKQYVQKIAYLDAIGKNDLKPISMKEADATTINKIELPLPKEGNAPPVVLEENMITTKGNPQTIEEAEKAVTPIDLYRFGEAEEREAVFFQDLAKENRSREEAGKELRWNIEEIRRNNQIQKSRLTEQFKPGTRVYYQIDDNTIIPAIVTAAMVETGSSKGNPFTNGKIWFMLATPMPFGNISVNMGDMLGANTLTRSQQDSFVADWQKVYADSKTKRERRYFLTGDVVRAASLYSGKTQVVQFQRSDKSMDYGWLLPKGFTKDQLEAPPVEATDKDVLKRLRDWETVVSSQKTVRFLPVNESRLEVIIKKNCKAGKAILADRELPEIMGKDAQYDYFSEKKIGSQKVFAETVWPADGKWPAIFARIKEILSKFKERITIPGKELFGGGTSDRTGALLLFGNRPAGVGGRGKQLNAVAKWASRGMSAAFDLAGQIAASGKSFVSFVSGLASRGLATARRFAAELWKDAHLLLASTSLNPRRGAVISIEAAKRAWEEAKKKAFAENWGKKESAVFQSGFKSGFKMVDKVAKEAVKWTTMKAIRDTIRQAKTLDRAIKGGLIQHAAKMSKDIRSEFLARIARATTPEAGLSIIMDMEAAKLEANRRRAYVELRQALKKLSPKTLRPEYKEMAADLLKRIASAKALDEANETTQFRQFNTIELHELAEEAQLIRYASDTDNKIIFGRQLKDAVQVGADIEAHIMTEPAITDEPTGKDEKSFFRWFFDEGSMNWEAVVERMGPVAYDLFYAKLNDGYRKGLSLWYEGRDSVSKAMEAVGRPRQDIETAKWAGETVEIPTTTGTAKMSRAHRLNLVASAMDASTRKEILKAGVKTDRNSNELMKFSEADLQAIEDSLTADEKAILKAMREFVNSKLKAAVNETWVLLSGAERAFRSDYWPRIRERAETGMNRWQTAWTAKHPLLEGLGIFKERTGGKSPLIIGDVFHVFNQHIKKATTFAGLAVPIRNIKVVMKSGGVEKAVNNRFGVQFSRRIDNHLDALQDMGAKEGGELNRGLFVLLRNIGTSVLGLNPRSMLKQFGGLMTQATEFGVDDMLAGLSGLIGGKKLHEQIFKYSPKLRERYDSSGARLIMPVFGGDDSFLTGKAEVGRHYLSKMQELSMLGLERFDQFIIQSIWKSSENQVRRENPDLSGDEFWEKVAARAEQVTARTQNTTSVIDMSGIALESRKAPTWKVVTAFQSQGNAIYNIMRRAIYQYGRGKIGKGEMARRIILGNIGNALVVALIVSLFGGSGEETEEKREEKRRIGKILSGIIQEQFGMIYGAGTLNASIRSIIEAINDSKGSWLQTRGMENVVESTINNAIRSVSDIIRGVVKWGERFKSGVRKGQEQGPAYLKSGVMRGLESLMAVYGLPRFPLQYVSELTGWRK